MYPRQALRLVAALLLFGLVNATPAADCQQPLITLAPSLTELAFAAGAGPCVIGVAAYSDWPEQATSLPVIGDAFQYDLERILAMGPVHALAWQGGSPPARVAQLETLGIEVTWIGIRVLEDVPRALATIGALAGDGRAAQTAADAFITKLHRLETSVPSAAPVRVFYQVSRQPLFTLGGHHLITDVIRRCGGENIFSAVRQEAVVVDFEAVLAANPTIMIAAETSNEPQPLRSWARFTDLEAVANGHLYTIDPNLLVRPTARILEGMEWLCRKIELAH